MRRWQHRTVWITATAVAAGMLMGAARLDYAALARHAAAGPHLFQTEGCAGHPQGGAAARATAPAVGLTAWTTFEGSTAHNAVLPAAAAAGGTFSASWRFPTGGSIVTAPTVVGGAVYAGSMDGCVYALDATTGHLLWSFLADNQVMSEPLVAGGSVFFGSGNKGMGLTPTGTVRGTGYSGLYALNAATGAEEWYLPTLGEDMPTPVYHNGVLYEAGGGKIFYAVSAATGKLLWQVADGSYVSMSSPALVGDIAVFGGADPYALVGVNIRTHQVAWTLPLAAANSGLDDVSPAAAGNTVYIQVPEGSAVKRVVELAVDARTGAVLWQTVLGTDVWNLVQRAAGRGELQAYDGEETGLSTVVAGRVYVGSPGLPDLWALDARTGAVIWRSHLSQPVRTPPAVAGNELYVTGNSTLFQLDASTGRLLQSHVYNTFTEGSGIMIPCTTAGPVIVGKTLLLAGGDNGNTVIATALGGLP